jgi:palmitoyl-protein thioesterase
MHPGIFIHSVYIDPDSKEDRRATFVRSELGPTHALCLHNITNSTAMSTTKWNSSHSSFKTYPSCPRASTQSGSHKVRAKVEQGGGSDTTTGGQFLRAYVERYNNPPIRNLVTFGSQHMGISDIPPCKPYDLLCNFVRNAARAGVYTEWAQKNLVQVTHSFALPSQQPSTSRSFFPPWPLALCLLSIADRPSTTATPPSSHNTLSRTIS